MIVFYALEGPMIKNILVIEDSTEMQLLLKVILESKGHHVDCISNGVEALNFLNLQKYLPDIILLDLQMPVMNGRDFLKMSQKNIKFKNIPIVLMSGEEDLQQTGEITRVAGILKKPLSMVSTVRAVESALRLH